MRLDGETTKITARAYGKCHAYSLLVVKMKTGTSEKHSYATVYV